MKANIKTGTLLKQRYEIIIFIRRGDFGVVYQTRDLKAGDARFVALKQMPMQMG
jgi:hypothetical protein